MNQEFDEIYELCKRIINEVPTAMVTFGIDTYGVTLFGLKNKKDFKKSDDEFKWDFHENIWWDDTEKKAHKKCKRTKAFLLELLIDGRCPLNAGSDGAEAPSNDGADNDGERTSGGVEQAESVHS